jgi:hypothetical protein
MEDILKAEAFDPAFLFGPYNYYMPIADILPLSTPSKISPWL